jgi:DNA-binding NtrC family response regulator
VLPAKNGLEALALYQKESANIDVVLTDIIMPHMDGNELFVELKELRPDLPIIVFTGAGEIFATDKIPRDQMADLLLKPVSMGRLSAAIYSALNNPNPLSTNSTQMCSRPEVF